MCARVSGTELASVRSKLRCAHYLETGVVRCCMDELPNENVGWDLNTLYASSNRIYDIHVYEPLGP